MIDVNMPRTEVKKCLLCGMAHHPKYRDRQNVPNDESYELADDSIDITQIQKYIPMIETPKQKKLAAECTEYVELVEKIMTKQLDEARERAAAPGRIPDMAERQIDEVVQLPLIKVSGGLAQAVDAQAGDVLYITDSRWWLGGLRSGHGRIESVDESDTAQRVHLGPELRRRILVRGRDAMALKVKRLH